MIERANITPVGLIPIYGGGWKNKKKSCDDDNMGTPIQLKVYDEFLKHRQIILNGPVNDEALEKVVLQIEKINFEDDDQEDHDKHFDRLHTPVTLYINSPGGTCVNGLAMASAIEQSRTPIYTVATGYAYSAAFLVLAAGHVRYAFRHAHLMYHQLSYWQGGMLYDHVKHVAGSLTMQDRMDRIMLERAIPEAAEQVKKINETLTDWYMWPEEAMKYGFIDGVVEKGVNVKRDPEQPPEALPKPVEEPPKKTTKVKKASLPSSARRPNGDG